jgi:hypothetical protein
MTFKAAIWYPIAAALSVINLVAVAFTAGSGGVWHPAIHAALALTFGILAERLRQRGGSERQGPAGTLEARFEALDAEVSKLRQELSETQERLDFAERLLAQGREARRMGPVG